MTFSLGLARTNNPPAETRQSPAVMQFIYNYYLNPNILTEYCAQLRIGEK